MTRSLTALTLLALLPACDLVASPTPLGPGDEATDSGCEETVVVLAGVDAASALGFTAADVLAVVEGTHAGPIAWSAGLNDGPATVEFGPESGEGQLTVGIAYQGGEVRHIISKPKPSGGDGLDDGGGFAAICNDRLEVDVVVDLDTAGGAFAESFTAPLRATTRGIGIVRHELALADFQGSFAATKVEPANAELGAIALEIGVSGEGLFGGASTMVTIEDGDVVGAGFVDIARWPSATSPCESWEAPVGLGAAVAGFSADDALALVAKAPALALTWQGGAPTDMTLALTPGAVACATLEGDAIGSLRIPSEAAVSTADGRWNGSFAVEVAATPAADGTLASVRVFIQAAYVSTVPAADFEAAFGIADVDLTGYDEGALDFSGEFLPAGDAATATGQVTVLGVKLHMCGNEPGGGCEGNTYDELDMATWSSQ